MLAGATLFGQSRSTSITDFFNGFNSDGTYTGSAQAVADYLGVDQTSPTNVRPVQGGRLVTNLLKGSSDLTNASWGVQNGAVKVSADTVTLAAQVSSNCYQLVPASELTPYTIMMEVQGPAGLPAQVSVLNTPAYSGTAEGQFIFTGERQIVGIKITSAAGATGLAVRLMAVGAVAMTIRMFRAMCVSGNQCYPLPSDTVTTATASSSLWFSTRQGSLFASSVCIGDSFTSPGVYIEEVRRNLGLPLTAITNKGIAGQTLAQMLARFNADVVALDPDVVLIGGGVNDIYASRTLAAMQADLAAMVDAALSAGIQPVLTTVPPSKNRASYTESVQTVTDQYNSWVRGYAADGGLELIDVYETLRTAGDATLLSTYDSGDHLHPNRYGYQAIAAAILDIYPSMPVSVQTGRTVRTRSGAVVKYADTYFGYKSSAAASTNYTRSTANVLRPNNFAVWGRCVPSATGQATVDLWSAWSDANNLLEVYMNATQVRFYKVVAGAFAGPVAAYTHASGTAFEFQVYQSAAGMGIRVKEDGGEWSAWAETTDATSQLDAVIPANYQIGAINNANHFAGNIPFIATIQHPEPKGEIERLSSKYP